MATTFLRRASAWLLALSLTGCTVSFHPMGMGKPSHNDHYSADWYGQGVPPPGVNPALANQGRPPMVMPNVSSNDVSLMLQKMSAIEDDRKTMSGKLQQVEVQMREKDQAIVQATYEIQESTKQIRRTRDEMQNWKQEMDDMRGKLRNVERENRQTLETVVKTLESYLDRDKGGSTSSGPRH
ncbi:MAG: hypothetical protein K2X38_02935 [Gemmataceae bacterium]|nr:hypothetical protein [Gemmataceae bacterium]